MSHEYQELFREHDCAGFLVSVNEPSERFSSLLEQALREPTRSELITRLIERAVELRKRTIHMLKEVDTVLGLQ